MAEFWHRRYRTTKAAEVTEYVDVTSAAPGTPELNAAAVSLADAVARDAEVTSHIYIPSALGTRAHEGP